QAIPRRRKPDFVRIRVLDDQPLERVRLTGDDAEADRSTGVLNVQPVAMKSLQLEKALDDLRDAVERVRERRRVRDVAEPEAGIVGSDDGDGTAKEAERR